MNKLLSDDEIKKLELKLFLDVLYKVYGIDLKHNSQVSITRRLKSLLVQYHKDTISELIPLLLYTPDFHDAVIQSITIQCSNLFRDPLFFLKLKKKVFPYLQTFSHIDIWIAGCANGEEVYSLLILLKEAELLDKTRIYATDISKEALSHAKSGVLRNGINAVDIKNYNKAGGKYSLSDYFVAGYAKFKLKDELLSHVVFEEHSLAQDGPFISAQLVLCRNVMIYFDGELQERVLKLIDSTLISKGYLGIGMEENLHLLSNAQNYQQIQNGMSIYKKE